MTSTAATLQSSSYSHRSCTRCGSSMSRLVVQQRATGWICSLCGRRAR